MVRWLEANGYDVSYIDRRRHRSPRRASCSEHKVFLSVGHDEYWSGDQRANVEAARDAGVNLAFFSGNEMFWKTRWETSIDGSATPYRTLVSYKETHANAKIDPLPDVWTGTWRDPRFSPPADGGRPENALTGTIFTVNCCIATRITVPAADGQDALLAQHRASRRSAPGRRRRSRAGTLGYEWDEDLDNGFRPAGLVRLSTTTVTGVAAPARLRLDYGPGTATHQPDALSPRRAARSCSAPAPCSGRGASTATTTAAARRPTSAMQQATVNLFADMGVQPATLQAGLVAATASTDTTPPDGDDHLAGRRRGRRRAAATVHDHAAPPRTPAAAWSAASRCRSTAAPPGIPPSGAPTWTYDWVVPVQSGSITLRRAPWTTAATSERPDAPVTVTTGGFQDPNQGPGRPDPGRSRGQPIRSARYYAEILRAEGLKAFASRTSRACRRRRSRLRRRHSRRDAAHRRAGDDADATG